MTPPQDTETAPVHSAPPLGGGGCPSCDHYESGSHTVGCYGIQSNSEARKERRKKGFCEYDSISNGNIGCSNKIVKCRYCGLLYCTNHLQGHLR